ncbi:hypothetical protein BWI17_14710 [Betaproteobacteria bacterium GR16-43]|nr:hypothetical protein BWI17_14710 [Betaproteobacteria bacterium GR16-43]
MRALSLLVAATALLCGNVQAQYPVQSLVIEGPSEINSLVDLNVQYRAKAVFTDGSTGYVNAIWHANSNGYGEGVFQAPGLFSVQSLGPTTIRVEYTQSYPPYYLSDQRTVTVVDGTPPTGEADYECGPVEAPVAPDGTLLQLPTGYTYDFLPLCNGMVLLSNSGLKRVQLVDAATGALRRNWQLNEIPGRLMRVPGTPYVFVTMYNASGAARLDLRGGPPEFINGAGTDVTLGEAGEVWMVRSVQGNPGVGRYDAATLALRGEMVHGSGMWRIHYDRERRLLYGAETGFSSGPVRRSSYSPKTRQLTLQQQVEIGSYTSALAVSPNGRHLIVPAGGGNGGFYAIYDFDPFNLTAHFGEFPVGPYPRHGEFRFDSKQLFATNGMDLLIYDVAAHQAVAGWTLPCYNAEFTKVRWSPSGRNLYAVGGCGDNYGGSRLFRASLPAPLGLAVTRSGLGTGSVSSTPNIQCPPDCIDSFASGTVVTLVAAADFGSVFIGWSGCGTVAGNTCTVTMDGARNVNAQFLRPVAGDFSLDGKVDIAWSHPDGRAAAWEMDGLVPKSQLELRAAGTGWSIAQVADFDGDGRSDIAWQHTDGRVSIDLSQSPLAPAAGTVVLSGGGWHVSHAADLNNDGRADLVWRHDDGRVAVWLMNGLQLAGSATILGPATGWSVARTADFDGDGKADLLWTHTDGRVAIWLMDGVTVKATNQILNAGSGWSPVQAADLDGDGKADIVWEHTDGRVAAWLMNGPAMGTGITLMGPGSGWSVVRTADFDGDGKRDLFWQHTDGRAAIWLMNGLVPATMAQILNFGSGWTIRTTADLDGDGKADILWQHSSGRVAAWLMNGTTLVNSTELLGPGTGWSVNP